MAISSTLTTSFKKELLEAVHNFKNSGGDTFKLALYTSSATLGATTTAFTTTGQARGTNYSSGGGTLTRVDPTKPNPPVTIIFFIFLMTWELD